MADRQAKILFHFFFQTSFRIINCKNLPVRRVRSIVSRMVHYPALYWSILYFFLPAAGERIAN